MTGFISCLTFTGTSGLYHWNIGDEKPWGILGLYDHLAGIRVDVEWAEDAAWRRAVSSITMTDCIMTPL